MCTVTIFRNTGRTIVTMNRDELRTRPEGATKRETTQHGVEYLFPVDALSGGTWMGINSRGIGACLLNRYGETHLRDDTEVQSRGTVIPKLLHYGSLDSAFQHLVELPLKRFKNFDLVLFDDSTILQFTHENGAGVPQRITVDWMMLSSSSWNKDSVLEYRKRKFNDYLSGQINHSNIARSVLGDFHLADYGNPRFAVLMSRTESHTKSVSQIVIERKNINFLYLDEHDLNRITDPRCSETSDSGGTLMFMKRHGLQGKAREVTDTIRVS